MTSERDARSDRSHLQSDHRSRSPGCGKQRRGWGGGHSLGTQPRSLLGVQHGAPLLPLREDISVTSALRLPPEEGSKPPAAVCGAHNGMPHAAQKSKARRKEPGGCRSRPAAVPLDFHALCAVHVVAFSVRSVVLGVGGGSRFEVLRVLGEFHSLGLGPRLVAELDQSHHHGQPEAPDQDIENPSNIAQAQSARLVLRETSHAVSLAVRSRQTDRQTENRLLALSPSWRNYPHGVQRCPGPGSAALPSGDCSVSRLCGGKPLADSKAMDICLATDVPRPCVPEPAPLRLSVSGGKGTGGSSDRESSGRVSSSFQRRPLQNRTKGETSDRYTRGVGECRKNY